MFTHVKETVFTTWYFTETFPGTTQQNIKLYSIFTIELLKQILESDTVGQTERKELYNSVQEISFLSCLFRKV